MSVLEFFPAMNVGYADKLRVVDAAMAIYCEHFRVVTMREHALSAAELLQAEQVKQNSADPAPCLRTDL